MFYSDVHFSSRHLPKIIIDWHFWQAVKYTFIDSLDTGRVIMNESYDKYCRGEKTLDAKWIGIQEGYNKNLIYTIIKVKDEYGLIDELKKRHKIVFDAKAKKHFVRLESELLEVRLNSKTNSLLLIKNDKYRTYMKFKQKL